MHATNGGGKAVEVVWLNGEDVSYRRFVCPSAVAYTECFMVPSYSE